VTKYIKPELLFSMSARRCESISVSGIAVADVKHWLQHIPVNRDVCHVVLHVGINTCFANVTDATGWLELYKLLKKVFPKAIVQFSSILPPFTPRTDLDFTVDESNFHLEEMCRKTGVCLIDNYSIFRTNRGRAKQASYADEIHPSREGTRKLAGNIKASIRQQRQEGKRGDAASRHSGQDGDGQHSMVGPSLSSSNQATSETQGVNSHTPQQAPVHSASTAQNWAPYPPQYNHLSSNRDSGPLAQGEHGGGQVFRPSEQRDLADTQRQRLHPQQQLPPHLRALMQYQMWLQAFHALPQFPHPAPVPYPFMHPPMTPVNPACH
jgi:hypothetical protein